MNFEKDWTPLSYDIGEREETTGNPMSYWQDVRRRFNSNTLAIIGVVLICLILIASTFGSMMTGKSYEEQELQLRNMPPIITVYNADNGSRFFLHPDLKLFTVDEKGRVGKALDHIGGSLKEKRFEYKVNGNTYFLSFGGGTTLLDGNENEITNTERIWNRNYLLGTDSVGRDMLTRLLYGGRISLTVAFIVTLCSLFIGEIGRAHV